MRGRFWPGLAAFLLTATPLAAQDAETFRSPSGNIACAGYDDEGKPGVRCDLAAVSKRSLRRPADCDLDFGQAFFVAAASDRGMAVCHGDTVADPEARVLPYGQDWRWKGLVCRSSPAGMRCVNARGAGFEISRERQRVF